MTDTGKPTDYKADFRRLEDMAHLGADTNGVVAEMEGLVNQWHDGLLTGDNEQLFLNQCFPRVVQRLIKCKAPTDDHINRIFKFLRVAMKVIIETMPRSIVAMADTLQHIFNHDNNFYHTRARPMEPWRLQEDELWANVPSSWHCDLTLDAINFFGSHQGFLVLFEHVANENTPIPMASALMSAANQCLLGGYITRQKIPDYIAGALASLKRLHTLNVHQLRLSKKEDFENIIKVANNILRYQLKQAEINERIESANLEVAKQCISSTGIEKRLYGVNHLVQVVDALKQSDTRRYDMYAGDDRGDRVTVKWISVQYLEDWLSASGIIEQLFGPNRHQQLLKPCAPILRFLAQRDKLSTADIGVIWICATTTHESISQLTLQLISDICSSLLPSHVQQFFSKVKAIPRPELTPHLLSFIASMCKATKEPTLRIQYLELLWDLVVDESISVDLSRAACNFVDEVVKLDALSSFRRAFIEQVMKLLDKTDTKSKALSCRLLKSLLSTFPTTSTHLGGETVTEVIRWLADTHQVVNKLLTELKEFKTACLAMPLPSSADPHMTVLAGRLPYGEELKARLEALQIVLSYYSNSMDPDNVIELWDWLYMKALSANEKDEVVIWFTNACSAPTNGFPPVDTASAARLFRERIINLPSSTMSTPAFQGFFKFFLETNSYFNKIKNLSQAEFLVLQDPSQLVGYQELWSIVLDCTNASVVETAIDMLNKIHEKTAPALQEGKGKQLIREAYIGRCIKQLEESEKAMNASPGAGQTNEDFDQAVARHRARIVRCVTILMKLVDSTEPPSSKQATVTRGIPILASVVVILDLPNVKRFKFSIASDSNSFYRPLRARIVDKIIQHVKVATLNTFELKEEDLVFLRSNRNSGAPIDGTDPGATANHTLSQLGFSDKDVIVVRRKPSIRHRESQFRLRSKIASQLDEKPPADAADKASNIADMWGIPKELATFALRKYGWDMNRVADIFVDDNKRSELMADARKAGISEDAEPVEAPTTEEDIVKAMNAKTAALLDTESPNANKVDPALPSTIITNDASLAVLFKLLQRHDEQISELVWNFVVHVPASPYLKRQLLAPLLPDGSVDPATVDKPNWPVLLPSEPYKLLYTLQLVDQILFPFDDSQFTFQRAQWAGWLVRTGGLTQLMKSFLDLPLLQFSNLSRADALHLRDCLTLVLKIVDCFFSFGRIRADLRDSAMPSNEFRALLLSQLELDGIPNLKDDSTATALLAQLVSVLNWSKNCKQPTSLVDNAWRVLVETLAQGSADFQKSAWDKLDNKLAESLLLSDDASLRLQTSRRLLDLCTLESSLDAESKIYSLLKQALPDPAIHLETKQHQRFAELFWLFEQLLTRALSRPETDASNTEFAELSSRFINYIRVRPVTELSAAYPSDQILRGAMRLLSKLVHRWRNGEIPAASLINDLFHDCLFAIKTHKSPLPKCKNPDSRIATYKLLVRIAQRNQQNLQQIVKLLARNHSGSYQQLGTWEYFVGSEDRAQVGYLGINNLGATCYMSALLQQFYMMPALRADLLSAPVAQPTEADNIVWQLQQMFGYLQESEKMSYNPKEFCASYKDLEGNAVNVTQQQDVNEFFNILCQRFEGSLKGTDHEKALAKQFVVTVADEIRSLDPTVAYSSEKDDEFYTIPLDVQHKGSLPEALDLFIKGDKLEGDNRVFVERVGRKIDATKRSVIKHLSKTVIFHLKRFEYEVASFRRNKLNHRFAFPLKLNLKRWTKAGVAASEGRTDEANQRPDEYYEYELVGVLIHSGMVDSGHYYSLIRERTNPRRWLQFNDRIVTEFEQDNIGPECFGGMHPVRTWDAFQRKHVVKEVPLERNAYMLFYERVNHDPSFDQPLVKQEKQGSSATTAVTDVAKTLGIGENGTLAGFSLPGGGNVPPLYDTLLFSNFQANLDKYKAAQDHIIAAAVAQVASAVSANQKAEAPKSNLVKLELVEGVPKPIHDLIWSENAVFMKERQVFDTVYFDFVLRLLSDLQFTPVMAFEHSKYTADISSDAVEATMEADFAFGMIKLATRIVVELISHAKLNLALPWWYSQLRRVFAIHLPACVWFVDYCRRNNIIKEVLLQCPFERTRIEFADTCQVITETLDHAVATYVPSPLKKAASSSSSATSSAVSATPSNTPSSQQIGGSALTATAVISAAQQASLAFLEIFVDLLEDSRPHWQRFRQFFQVIRDCAALSWRQRQYLLDKELLQQYEDYFMGHSSVKYPNRPRIMDETHLPDLFEFVDTLSILVRGCHNETPGVSPPNQIKDKVLDMPPAGRAAIFSNVFFGSFLEMEYNIPATCEILTFFSYNSVERSEMILENVLKLFETSAAHKMSLYEALMESLLNLKDELQERRIRKGVTSFKYQSVLSSSKAKGLVGIAQKMHEDRNRSALDVAKFVVKLARDNKQVYDFLAKRTADLTWLKEFLETKLEEELPGNKLSSTQVDEDLPKLNVFASNIVGHNEIKPEITKENWRASSHYGCIVFVTHMLRDVPQQVNPDDKLLELSDQMTKLKQEVEQLKKDKEQLLEGLRQYQVALPGFQLTPPFNTTVSALLAGYLIEYHRKNLGAAGNAGAGANGDLATAGAAALRAGGQQADREMTEINPNHGAVVVVGGTPQHSSLPNWVPGQSGNANLTNVGGEDKKENQEQPTGQVQGPLNRQDLDGLEDVTDAIPFDRHNGKRRNGRFDPEHDWQGQFSDDEYPDHDQAELLNRGRRPGNDAWHLNQMHHGGAGHYKPKEPDLPHDIDERLGQLRMIFETINDDTLMVALQHNGFDPNRAADDLFDPTRVDMYNREAKSKKEQQAAEKRLQAQQQQQAPQHNQQQPIQQGAPTNQVSQHQQMGTASDDDDEAMLRDHGPGVDDSDGDMQTRLNVSSDDN